MKLSWNWLQDYVRISKSVHEVSERLTMAGLEVKKISPVGDDFLLETEITSNRPDWLSHLGVAREIAACYGLKLHVPDQNFGAAKNTVQRMSVQIEDLKLCSYYAGVVVEEVKNISTPTWMRNRLEVCGLRSINFLVDVTNYVLLELGQPLHAFDLELLSGNCIFVRRAKHDEPIETLDNKRYLLTNGDCVIADSKHAIALGGIMGGRGSEVRSETRSIFLEAALFDASVIRKTSKRLKLATDSSYRFERQVYFGQVVSGRNRALHLIRKHIPNSNIGTIAFTGKVREKKLTVSLSISEMTKILGCNVPEGRVKRILSGLGFGITGKKPVLKCQVPPFRLDVSNQVDLIEEVARIYGYEHVKPTIPNAQLSDASENPLCRVMNKARDVAVALGFREIVTFSIVDPEIYAHLNTADRERWVSIVNPRNHQLTLMRPSLVLSFMDVVARNNSVGAKSIKLFEIGSRYYKLGKGLPVEDRTFALCLSGDIQSNWMNQRMSANFFTLKGMIHEMLRLLKVDFVENGYLNPLFEPEESFELLHQGKPIGCYGTLRSAISSQYGQIEAPVFFGELSLSIISSIQPSIRQVHELSKFPSILRDLTLTVNQSISSGKIISEIKALDKSGWLIDVSVFDVYRGSKLGKDRKSISFRLTYQSNERTLEANEINKAYFSLVDELAKKINAELPTKS